MEMTKEDLEDLRCAKELLEYVGFATKLADLFGTPIEKAVELLPKDWQTKIATITGEALGFALKTALLTIRDEQSKDSYPRWHKAAATISGAVGGFYGVAALAAELPVSTTIMMRSIADIARANGESLNTADCKLACLQVFAFGDLKKSGDAADSGYYTVRTSLAHLLKEAGEILVSKTLADETAKPLARLIAAIATRFNSQVVEKVAAVLVPMIGAVGGGAVNLLFIDHFQDMARGHFTIRRLERKYSPEIVRNAYESMNS